MEYILTESDISYCRRAVDDLDDDGNGLISIFDLETVLQRLDLHFEEFELCKLISELDSKNTGEIEFDQILEIYQKKRQAEVYGEDDAVTLDAYTAIGGPSDKSGHVDGKVLVRIIKEEFELPIDIEELIRSVDDSGNG
jgi:Ca2+-binding EF-hand superfamily protein